MSFEKDTADKVVMPVKASELTTMMAAAEDVHDAQGKLLLAKGQRLSLPMIYHLQGCVQLGEIPERFSMELLSEES